MFALTHPEVLSIDWLPPTLPGRGGSLAQAERILQPEPERGRARLLAVEGPPGAGTSAVARRVARAWVERRSVGTSKVDGRFLAVRVSSCRGISAVAGALLRHFDSGFEARGFPTMEILAGCLRRVKREGAPTAIVLDDIDPYAPPVQAILRALESPVRFLPEGDEGMPPLTVVLAGRPSTIERVKRQTGLSVPRISLPAYSLSELVTITRERVARALGREPPGEMAEEIARRAWAEGRGASRALDLLRRELIGWTASRPSSVYASLDTERRVIVEEHLIHAIVQACRSGPPTLARVRACERTAARETGVTPLPITTLWRRIVRLEQAGYLRREVRTGGFGGTQSRVHLLLPISGWFTAPRARGTPRGSAPVFSGLGLGSSEASPPSV